MELYSTNNHNNRVDFKQAVFQSLPEDKGLYMPLLLKKLDDEWMNSIENYSFQEIAKKVTNHLLKDDFSEETINNLIDEVINFPAPLVFLEDDLAVLELFHGPSFAFKDFGARFMSRVMAHYSKKDNQLLDVLVATSGDTGGAVALGFLGVEGTRVTILYPKGKVSPIQELQLTANGKNICAIEIDGTFDDCQALVKQAFLDKDLMKNLNLTSANSINIARLIPQSFYYFEAFAQAKRKGFEKVSFVVPSGNFGNITAGILALKLGLEVEQFVAATNANDTVPSFLKTENYQPKPSVQTLSNAMDVGNPSNWVRVMEFFEQDVEQLKSKMVSKAYSDVETINAIVEINQEYNYIACPHTSIAWLAAKEYQAKKQDEKELVVFLSTAHPCKFPEVFPKEIRDKIVYPKEVEELKLKQSNKVEMNNNFDELKNWLLNN
ncbi:threonine synthase [Empedobacter falsenii]|uniref:threonine synthase n=1 Tax=Empedobacter falsenii TaxID=343874 RepID=UPI002578F3E0|nr:threonine synthase [Empedobacter falsenii]MDM1548938.1 threonine synthase [Empedobacter falsenii]